MSFRSFRHHLSECEYFQGDNVTSQTAVPQIESLTENESIDGSLDVNFDVAEKPMVCEKQVQEAKLFLNLRTKFNVTNSALNFVSAEMTNLNSQTNRSAFYIKNLVSNHPSSYCRYSNAAGQIVLKVTP
jgi:hypothetical protein